MSLTERLLRLLRVPSPTGEERAICDFLVDQLRRDGPGYAIERVGNAFALFPAQRRREQLVAFVGHLDTVPDTGGNPPHVAGERIFGRGAADMKSGLAVMWGLIADPPAAPRYDLAFLFYDGEEGPYDDSGLGPLLAELPWLDQVDLALCLEPSDNVLELGCMGTLHARVTYHGRAAHSARPWQGENAIYKAAPLLTRLAGRGPEEVTCEGLSYREVASVTLARGGTARNMIPDCFEVNLNLRFAPSCSLREAQQRTHELVGPAARIAFTDLAPSGPIPRDNPLLHRLRHELELPVAPKQAWTDVARLAAAGVAAVNLGPGENAQAHQPDESTSIPQLEDGDQLLRRFVSAD